MKSGLHLGRWFGIDVIVHWTSPPPLPPPGSAASIQACRCGRRRGVWRTTSRFPVVERGQVIGVLHRVDLLSGVAQGRWDATVRDVMARDCQFIEETMPWTRPSPSCNSRAARCCPCCTATASWAC